RSIDKNSRASLHSRNPVIAGSVVTEVPSGWRRRTRESLRSREAGSADRRLVAGVSHRPLLKRDALPGTELYAFPRVLGSILPAYVRAGTEVEHHVRLRGRVAGRVEEVAVGVLVEPVEEPGIVAIEHSDAL